MLCRNLCSRPRPSPSCEVNSFHAKSAEVDLPARHSCIATFVWTRWDVCRAKAGDHNGRLATEWNVAAGSDAGGDGKKCAGHFEEAACASGVWIHQRKKAGRECGWRGGAEVVGGAGTGGQPYLRAHGSGT